MTEELGKKFITKWYQMIDSKVPFEELVKYVDKKNLVVDFPDNKMDLVGFRIWYEGQCHGFTGVHHIHEIKSWEENNAIVVLAIITWTAEDLQGKKVELYPDVTICLNQDTGLVEYYGCIDRTASGEK